MYILYTILADLPVVDAVECAVPDQEHSVIHTIHIYTCI